MAVESFARRGDDVLRRAWISRKTIYELRKRAVEDGPLAVLEPGSRRPRSSPTAVDDASVRNASQVRAALEQSGLDHGPISVHDREMPPIPIRTITTRANQPEITPSQEVRERRVRANGSVSISGIQFQISGTLAGQTIRTIETLDGVLFTDLDGTVLLEHPSPTPGTTYGSNGEPRSTRPTPSPRS